MEGEVMSMHDIFVFKQTGVDEDRVAQGYFSPPGSGPSAWSGWRVSGDDVCRSAMFEQARSS